MDLDLMYGAGTFTPHVKLSHFCSADGGAQPGGGASAGDAGGGAGGADAGGGGADAGGAGADAGGGGGNTEDSFLSDAAQDQPGDTTQDTQTDTTQTAEGTDQTQTAGEEEIDPVTGQPKPKPQPQLTPEQQEQQRVEDETLKDFYAQTPALKEFLKANPAARAQFFKAAQMNQIYSSVEDAKMAAEYSAELSNFDRLFASPKPEDTKSFVDSLWKNSLRNPDQDFHPTANPSRGAFERVAVAMTEVGFRGVLQNIENAAKTVGLNPQQATRALEYVASMLGINVSGLNQITGSAAGQTQAGGNGQARGQDTEVASLRRELAALKETNTTQAQQAFESSVQTKIHTHVDTEVAKILKPAETALAKQPKFIQDNIRQTIVARTVAAIESDKPFQVRFNTAELRGDRGPQHVEELVNLWRSRVNEELPKQAASVLQEAGLSVVQANTQRLNAKQAAAGKREVPSSAGPGRVAAPGARPSGRGGPQNAGKGQSWDQHADVTLKDFIEGP